MSCVLYYSNFCENSKTILQKIAKSNIKNNLHLASISGGTDIVSCFVTGNPNMDIYSGGTQRETIIKLAAVSNL